mmetsp:Transcript_24265/g.43002  ORF Transcript_24265/g.43002 Transcript_24265/m.43002 type:complete len:243 (+) Transcript_24265:404-1132(+)
MIDVRLRLKVDSTHLPRRHFTKVSRVCVFVLLDGDQRRSLRKKNRRLQAVVIAPQARRQSNVASIVKLIVLDVPFSVERKLAAEELHFVSGVVPVQLDGDAARRVAVAPGIDQPVIIGCGLEHDCVHALAVRSIRAVSGACGARRRLVHGPVRIAWNRKVFQRESGRNVVLARPRLGLEVDPRQVVVRGLCVLIFGRVGGLVLLEPEAELHVVAEEFGSDFLVGVQHDSLVLAAPQPSGVLA